MNKKDRRKIRVLSGLLILVLAVAGSFVSANAASAKLNKKTATVVSGKTVKLKVKNTGSAVKWSSSNKKVATVKKSGKYGAVVTGKKVGNATITAKVGKKKLKCKITVKENMQPGHVYYAFTDDLAVTPVGKAVDLFEYVYCGGKDCKYLSNNFRKKYFKWTTSDPSVFSINKYGIATGKKTGTAKVRMKTKYNDGTWKKSSVVTVQVRDIGNITISFQKGLNEEWVQNNDYLRKSYKNYKKNSNETGFYNYMIYTVRNDSDHDIYMSRKIPHKSGGSVAVGTGARAIPIDAFDNKDYDYTYSCPWLYTESRENVLVPKHTTMDVIYKNEKLLFYPPLYSGRNISYSVDYYFDNDEIYATYYPELNSWEYGISVKK